MITVSFKEDAMEHLPDDQKAADHMMKVIAHTLGELHILYPEKGSFTASAALLTAAILMLVELTGRERAARAVRALAGGIEEGRFDHFTNRYRHPLH